ncbi:MAG: twin-arginine translocase subunit TatC [Phycisphaerae bacterium]|nr:twin-arginine translocase subunit TatC [Phycisphaerae bacterium]
MTETDKKRKDGSYFDNSTMSFGDHLMDLRSRIIKALIALTLGFFLCLFFGQDIMAFIFRPLFLAQDAAGQQMGLSMLSPPEYFLTYIKVCMIAGLVVSSPYVFTQIWGFIAAGLYPNEKKMVNMFVPFSAALFVLGSLFFITIVAPLCFKFFIDFSNRFEFKAPEKGGFSSRMMGNSDDKAKEKDKLQIEQEPIADSFYYSDKNITIYYRVSDRNSLLAKVLKPFIGDRKSDVKAKPKTRKVSIDSRFSIKYYFSFVSMLLLAFGIAFQMPLVVLLLSRLGMVSIEQFASTRKYVLFGIVVFAAIITPPDVISQIAMAVPMYVLYEIGILLARIYPKAKAVE